MNSTPYYDRDGITIYCGDNRDILPHLGRFDLLLTDPPYGIDIVNSLKKATESASSMFNRSMVGDQSGAWDEKPADSESVAAMISAANDSIVWGGNYFMNTIAAASRCWLVWDKCNGGNPMADAELAYTSLSGSVRIFRMHHFSQGYGHKVHPTQKPVPLMRWCLTLCHDAKTILDPFMGSGTTLLAAKLEGRRAVGIEINEAYCKIAVERLRQRVLDYSEEVTR